MNTFAIYSLETGLIVSHFTGSIEHLALNTREGFASIAGHYDPLSQRVDLDTGTVVDYRPPQPSSDHEWAEDVKRWRLNAEVQAAADRRAQAMSDIAALETRQLRPLRELAVNPDDTGARQRVREINAAIAVERAKL